MSHRLDWCAQPVGPIIGLDHTSQTDRPIIRRA
jgi:hypothetical protein